MKLKTSIAIGHQHSPKKKTLICRVALANHEFVRNHLVNNRHIPHEQRQFRILSENDVMFIVIFKIQILYGFLQAGMSLRTYKVCLRSNETVCLDLLFQKLSVNYNMSPSKRSPAPSNQHSKI